VRQALKQLLDDIARRRLARNANVRIEQSVKLAYRQLVLGQGNRLTIGEGSIIDGSLVFERDTGEIVIGRNCFIGNSLLVCSTRIEVGDDVLISWGCNIVDHNSHSVAWSKREDDVKDWYQGRDHKDWTHVRMGPVIIGSRSWIGMKVIVLPGVEIGEGAVVGAGSVVTRRVPPWTVVCGNPARVVRSLGPDER